MPEPGLLAGAVINDLALDTFLTELNRRLIKSAGRERQIGHSLFMDGDQPIEGAATLGQVMRLEVIPLIQEIAYDDYGRLAEYLGPDIVNVDEQRLTSLVEDDDDLIAALVTEYKASSDTATQ